jgi:hypothetical protein
MLRYVSPVRSGAGEGCGVELTLSRAIRSHVGSSTKPAECFGVPLIPSRDLSRCGANVPDAEMSLVDGMRRVWRHAPLMGSGRVKLPRIAY